MNDKAFCVSHIRQVRKKLQIVDETFCRIGITFDSKNYDTTSVSVSKIFIYLTVRRIGLQSGIFDP